MGFFRVTHGTLQTSKGAFSGDKRGGPSEVFEVDDAEVAGVADVVAVPAPQAKTEAAPAKEKKPSVFKFKEDTK